MTDHFIDALAAKNNGAVDNGTITSRGESRITQQDTKNGPVVIKRAAIHGWSCDACHTIGSGWADIEAHFERTEHRIYTEMR